MTSVRPFKRNVNAETDGDALLSHAGRRGVIARDLLIKFPFQSSHCAVCSRRMSYPQRPTGLLGIASSSFLMSLAVKPLGSAGVALGSSSWSQGLALIRFMRIRKR